jgi:hypothetical protein
MEVRQMIHAFEILTHRISLSIVLAVALAAVFVPSIPAQARGGFGGGGLRGGGFGGGGFAGGAQRPDMGGYPSSFGQGVQIPRTSIDSDRFDRDNTFNVDGSDWGWGGDGAWGAATLGAATVSGLVGAGPSSVIYSLPFGCDPYEYCNGAYYQPVYLGSTLGYQPYFPY